MTLTDHGAMPELPEAEFPHNIGTPRYTADQMREYARAAIQQAAGAVPKMPTVPDNMQDWAGMDGTTAWHLIERHADNWADIGKMMGEWLAANSQQPVHLGGGEVGGVPQPRYRLLNNGDVIEKHDEFIQDDGVTWLNPVGWEVGARYGPPFKTARRPESPTGQINKPVSGTEGGGK